MILAVSRLLLDARFAGSVSTPQAVRLVTELLGQIDERLDQPDAGLWELRGVRRLHSFTALAHWAGARRAAEIGLTLGSTELTDQATAITDARRACSRSAAGTPRSAP